jgi:hypothetical protein
MLCHKHHINRGVARPQCDVGVCFRWHLEKWNLPQNGFKLHFEVQWGYDGLLLGNNSVFSTSTSWFWTTTALTAQFHSRTRLVLSLSVWLHCVKAPHHEFLSVQVLEPNKIILGGNTQNGQNHIFPNYQQTFRTCRYNIGLIGTNTKYEREKWSEVDIFLPWSPKFLLVKITSQGEPQSKFQQVTLFLDMLRPSNIT